MDVPIRGVAQNDLDLMFATVVDERDLAECAHLPIEHDPRRDRIAVAAHVDPVGRLPVPVLHPVPGPFRGQTRCDAQEIPGPLQLHHGTGDRDVPPAASEQLYAEMQAAGKLVELYTYTGDNHNLAGYFTLAMNRTIAFFDTYLKP